MRWETLLIDSAHCAEAQILSRSGHLRTTTFSAMPAGKGGNSEEIC